ncbi:MAG: helix-turn-helix transcriptional regulator [Coriobacteriales bacterium]|nr:helix-turn-helix transcriptional regulator [Coriobacteriales bacterium]
MIATLGSIGTLGVLLSGLSAYGGPEAFAYLGTTITGTCMTSLLLLWSNAFFADERGLGKILIAGSIALGVIISLMMFLLQPIGCIVVEALFPIISALILVFHKKRMDGPVSPKPVDQEPLPRKPKSICLSGDKAPVKSPLSVFGLPWRLAVALVVFSCAIVLLQHMFKPLTPQDLMVSNTLQLIGRLVVALVVFFGFALFNWKPHVTFRFGFLIMIAGYLIFPFVQGQYQGYALIAVMMGYTCFYLMVWSAVLEILCVEDTPPLRVFGVTQLSIALGLMLGHILGFIMDSESFGIVEVTRASTACVYLLMTVTTLVLSENHIAGYWSLLKVMPETSVRQQDLSTRCKELGEEFSLTTREVEMLMLLARGRSIPYVTERLHVSESTARTHMKHIYEKLNVHTKQDLIDLVDSDLADTSLSQ